MKDKEKLRQALYNYTGDLDSLNQFASIASEELGPNWMDYIIDFLDNLSNDERDLLIHAYRYYGASIAWNELEGYMGQNTPLDTQLIQERIPVMAEWLSFYGPAGEEAIQRLKEKLKTEISQEVPVISDQGNEDEATAQAPYYSDEVPSPNQQEKAENNSTQIHMTDQEEEASQHENLNTVDQTNIEVAAPIQSYDNSTTSHEEVSEYEETLSSSESHTENHSETPSQTDPEENISWAVKKIFNQISLTQSIQAWVAARCVALGNIEVFAYPHYGFIVDLMQQTSREIKEVLNSREELTALKESYPEGILRLQNALISLEKDLQIAYQNSNSEEAPLTKANLSGNDLKRVLGQLDTSKQPEYLGPAPDGFEAINDPYEKMDDTEIKNQYDKIENIVFSEQSESNSPTKNTNSIEPEKRTSQTPQNGVKRNLSFSFGNKANKPSDN